MRLSAMRFPPSLEPGARVALVAPSGPLRGAEDLAIAMTNARACGWDPIAGSHALERDGYLAGGDGDRLADLNRALNDDRVDGIWCIRGGYGLMRILGGVDYDALVRRPRAIIGYSNITALHAAAGNRADLVTFHGPTGREILTPFSTDSLCRAVMIG